jgi:hypothetical protein
MASDAQETLYRIFAALSGTPFGPLSGGLTGPVADAASPAGKEIESDAQETPYGILASLSGTSLGPLSGGLTGSVADAVSPAGTAKPDTSSAASIALDVVKSGLGLVPLVTTLFGLFGGGDNPAPAPLTKYAMPARVNFEAAETADGLASVDYGQSGAPRSYAPAPQVNVTVQAMDARSFLDRSSDIAAAVREAMLNLNSINDVVNEL